jgi:perosamine synthetase
MSKPIAISLSPNTRPVDIRQARRVLFRPSLWHDRESIANAAAEIASLFPKHFVALTSSGRQALYDTLRAFGIRKGDEVIIQAFTCIAVPAPILWTGATPVYADIVPETYNLDPEDVRQKITKRTKAIVVQHTFGIPGPIEELQALAKEYDLYLIEDCAHSLGGQYMEKPLGTYGDAAILSFGRDKMISSVFGGAVVSKDKHRIDTIQAVGRKRPYPSALWTIQQLLHPLVFHAILPHYFRTDISKAALIAAQKLGIVSKAVEEREREGKQPRHMQYQFSPALAHLVLLQLQTFSKDLQRRREIASRYMTALQDTKAILPAVEKDTDPSWLRFPLQVDNPQEIHKYARQQHMLLGDWYDAPLVPTGNSFDAFGYTKGTCPQAERTSRHVINLPTYPALTDEQVETVIQFLHKHYD